MYQDKLASLKRQLQQLQEGNHFFSYDWSLWGVFQMWMSLIVALHLMRCEICVNCGTQNKARSWLMVVVRDYIIRLWRQLQRKFNRHCLALQTRNQLRNWDKLVTNSLLPQMSHFESSHVFVVYYSWHMSSCGRINMDPWTYFCHHASYHHINQPTFFLIKISEQLAGPSLHQLSHELFYCWDWCWV